MTNESMPLTYSVVGRELAIVVANATVWSGTTFARDLADRVTPTITVQAPTLMHIWWFPKCVRGLTKAAVNV